MFKSGIVKKNIYIFTNTLQVKSPADVDGHASRTNRVDELCVYGMPGGPGGNVGSAVLQSVSARTGRKSTVRAAARFKSSAATVKVYNVL